MPRHLARAEVLLVWRRRRRPRRRRAVRAVRGVRGVRGVAALGALTAVGAVGRAGWGRPLLHHGRGLGVARRPLLLLRPPLARQLRLVRVRGGVRVRARARARARVSLLC